MFIIHVYDVYNNMYYYVSLLLQADEFNGLLSRCARPVRRLCVFWFLKKYDRPYTADWWNVQKNVSQFFTFLLSFPNGSRLFHLSRNLRGSPASYTQVWKRIIMRYNYWLCMIVYIAHFQRAWKLFTINIIIL